MPASHDTHSQVIGYLLWIFGFTGAHRFYYGKPVTGTIWFFTAGLLLIGWFIDLFLIPLMDRQADRGFVAGPTDYTIAWLLLTFLCCFGLHRFYLGKWVTGILYLFTGGLLLIGVHYDFWTLNQTSERGQPGPKGSAVIQTGSAGGQTSPLTRTWNLPSAVHPPS